MLSCFLLLALNKLDLVKKKKTVTVMLLGRCIAMDISDFFSVPKSYTLTLKSKFNNI